MKKIALLGSTLLLTTCAFVSVGATQPASAHTGTAADPWHNEHVIFARTTQPGSIAQVYQDITPNNGAATSFYASDSIFTGHPGGVQTGFYIGPQTNGALHGSQGSGTAAKTVEFSLFGVHMANGDPFRNLDGVHCALGADVGVGSGAGISCSKPYGWTVGASYRVSVDIILSSSPSQCPVTSPTVCLVYHGYMGLTSQPLTRTQIGVWSADLGVFGDVSLVDSFAEAFGGNCTTHPNGRFVIPTFQIGSTDYGGAGISGSDSGTAGECGRSWKDTILSTTISVATP